MDSAAASFGAVHAAWLVGAALSGLILWLRPRARLALVFLIGAHGAAYLAYYSGLGRPYAIGVGSDRAIVMGMARAVADGGSAYDHVQVNFGNLEPLWTWLVAALAGFSSDRVPVVYFLAPIVSLGLTAIGFFVAWARPRDDEEADDASWRGVIVAASVLGLSSITLPGSPLQFFWQANFVFKPNHSLAFVCVGLLSRFAFERMSWWRLAVIQTLLFWLFILDWAYAAPGIVIGALLSQDRGAALRKSAWSACIALLLGAPYLVHLLRDYNPAAKEGVPEIWRDRLGEALTPHYLWSIDLSVLLILYALGLTLMIRRRRLEPVATGFLVSGPLVATSYIVGTQVDFLPEIDEGYSYWRLVAAVGAGYAIFRAVKAIRQRAPGRLGGIAWPVAFTAVLACSFPVHFNPIKDDRLYARSLTPLPRSLIATAAWLRENTTVKAVIISADGITLAGLTGRRFLMVRPGQTADRAEREWVERTVLTSTDERRVREAAAQYGVTHIVIEERLSAKYRTADLAGLGDRPWFEPALANGYGRILTLRP